MPSIGVYIATYERVGLLRSTLDALARQSRRPDEIVVADSSRSPGARLAFEAFAASVPELATRYVASPCRALPRLRWLASREGTADIVLFLDDDVCLAPSALAVLERAYDTLGRRPEGPPAGIGFVKTWDDGSQPRREATTWRERWLGTNRSPSGRLTRGGLSVSLAGVTANGTGAGIARVEHLWGGAMSFRREVLTRVGFLDRLAELYRLGIGRGEDVVLSRYAGEHGDLFLLIDPLALHRKEAPAEATPYASAGWRLGLTATWGRAHTLRWVAADRAAYRADWARLATLELARSVLAIARRPVSPRGWQRLGGATVGIARSLVNWQSIPASARSASGTEASWQS